MSLSFVRRCPAMSESIRVQETRAALLATPVSAGNSRSPPGLQVLTTMLEEDRTAFCGRRYQHQDARQASRAGTVPSEAVLGGRKVAIRRPRVRAHGAEVPFPTFCRRDARLLF